MRRALILVALAVTLLAAAALAMLDRGPARFELDFPGPSGLVVGDLMLPEGDGPFPALIIAHGDGPMPRDGFGYYAAWREPLAAAGYATLSWDKPGVGESEGDWLAQSMSDRALELRAAAQMLQGLSGDIDPARIGLLSFSQGVWAAPRAALAGEISALVAISGPVNWMRQSRALTHQRLAEAGAGPEQAALALACARLETTLLERRASHGDYAAAMAGRPECGDVMTAARWGFVLRNHGADARADIAALGVPALAVFGALDGNLDPNTEARNWRAALAAGDPRSAVRVIEGAGHALAPANERELANGATSWRNLMLLARARLWGEAALAPGAFEAVRDWLDAIWRG